MRSKLRSAEYKIPSLLLISAFVFAGCSSDGSSEPNTVNPNESDTVTGTDSGTTVMDTDTGTVTGTDAGTVTDTDSGTTVTGTDAGTVTGTDSGAADIGITDTGNTDIGMTDTGITDTGVTDSGTADIGTTDTGTTDTGVTDIGTADIGMTDTGNTDTGVTDTGNTDTGNTDTGNTDTGVTDIGVTDVGGPDIGTTDAGTGGGTSSPTTVGLADCAALSANGSSASIAGLYDISESFGPNLVDVAYLEISSNGALTLYDYQQDDLDEGDNCYIIETGISVLSPLGNNEFESNYYDDVDLNCDIISEQATIIRTESELTATFVDTEDDDEDGDTTEFISDVLPVATGLTTESFNRCE